MAQAAAPDTQAITALAASAGWDGAVKITWALPAALQDRVGILLTIAGTSAVGTASDAICLPPHTEMYVWGGASSTAVYEVSAMPLLAGDAAAPRTGPVRVHTPPCPPARCGKVRGGAALGTVSAPWGAAAAGGGGWGTCRPGAGPRPRNHVTVEGIRPALAGQAYEGELRVACPGKATASTARDAVRTLPWPPQASLTAGTPLITRGPAPDTVGGMVGRLAPLPGALVNADGTLDVTDAEWTLRGAGGAPLRLEAEVALTGAVAWQRDPRVAVCIDALGRPVGGAFQGSEGAPAPGTLPGLPLRLATASFVSDEVQLEVGYFLQDDAGRVLRATQEGDDRWRLSMFKPADERGTDVVLFLRTGLVAAGATV